MDRHLRFLVVSIGISAIEQMRRTHQGFFIMVAMLLVGIACRRVETTSRGHETASTTAVRVAAPAAPILVSTPIAPRAASTSAASPARDLRNAHAPAPDGANECERLCQISQPLGCKRGKECRTQCQSMASSPICRPEIERLFKCLLLEPTAHWECDEEGIGAIRDPYCGHEQSAVFRCFERHPPR